MFTKLREPQQRAFDSILKAWDNNPDPTLVEIATGVGKTPLAAAIAEHRKGIGRTMFVAHRKELVHQGADKFKEVMGQSPAIEMAKYRAHADLWGQKANVVIASTQTMLAGHGGQGRMSRYNPMEFATLIIDECHHYPANKGKWHTIAHHFMQNPFLRVLGLTATADRADGKAMGTLFKSVAFVYPIKQAIDDGWLVPVDVVAGTLSDLNLSNVREVAGDLNAEQLAEVMETKSNLFGVADEIVKRCGDRKTLIFASGVNHARLLSAILNNRKPGSAHYVCDKTDPSARTTLFSDFRANRFQYLSNFGIATEGFDDPGIEVVVIARPTKSRSLYAQMIGRGTRVLGGLVDQWDNADDRRVAIGESSKPCVEIIEFAGNAGKHKLISALDLLGGDYSPEVVDTARKIILDRDDALPVADAMRLAQLKFWEDKKQQDEQDEMDRLARLKVSANAIYQKVNPFDATFSQADRTENFGKGKRIPAKMMELLERHAPKDIDLNKIDIATAAKIHKEILYRFQHKLCTVKMAKVLEQKGLPSEIPMNLARDWMDKLAQNKWKVSSELRKEAEAFKKIA